MSLPEAGKPRPDDLFNPYQAPETPSTSEHPAPADELAILAHWERLRVAYNLILAAEVAVLLIGALPGGRRLWNFATMLPIYALLANVCFCAGPVATAYAHWIGLPVRPVSFALFGLGTLLAVLLTAIIVYFHIFTSPFPI